jgi:hypothetical protein
MKTILLLDLFAVLGIVGFALIWFGLQREWPRD